LENLLCFSRLRLEVPLAFALSFLYGLPIFRKFGGLLRIGSKVGGNGGAFSTGMLVLVGGSIEGGRKKGGFVTIVGGSG